MSIRKGISSSESVSEGHPDKLADRISDRVLDAFLEWRLEHMSLKDYPLGQAFRDDPGSSEQSAALATSPRTCSKNHIAGFLPVGFVQGPMFVGLDLIKSLDHPP